MSCGTCRNWLTQRVTDYEDGTRIVNLSCPDGKGKCEFLNIETPKDFSCNKHVEGHEHIEIMGKKTGSPWHHSHWGECPDCNGLGHSCRRCAWTGRVLYYDDGYIGEEQTRKHPNELKGQVAPQIHKCLNCTKDVDPLWLACPYCGTKTNKPDDPIRVQEVL